MDHNKGRFLSSKYSEETITAIIEESLNGSFKLSIFDMRPGEPRKHFTLFPLSANHLVLIRQKHPKQAMVQLQMPKSERIGTQLRFTQFHHDQSVGYADLWVDENTLDRIRKEFGEGDRGQNKEISIASLSPKEKEDRKQQIADLSLEKRSNFIKLRGDEIYSELEKKYRAKFNKEVVAELIRQEEKLLYESTGIDLPPVGSYLKHTRATKKAERSVRK